MFTRLARGIDARPLLTIIVWLAIVLSCAAVGMVGVTGERVFDRVETELSPVPGTESARAEEIAEANAGLGPAYTLIVSGVDPLDPREMADLVGPLTSTANEILAMPHVAQVLFPMPGETALANPAAAALIAKDQRGFLFVASLESGLSTQDEEEAGRGLEERLGQAAKQFEEVDGVSTILGAEPMTVRAIVHQMDKDLVKGETTALPIAFLVMIVVFGGLIAACLPLFGALAAIATTMGALFFLARPLEMHSSVLNVITIVAVGLSVDYGLLVVSRFREEVRAAREQPASSTTSKERELVRQALERTMTTAGKTVMYSALTLAAAITGLFVFKARLFETYAIGAIIVVLIALATATTLVPACLRLLGTRVAKPSLIARAPVIGRIMDIQDEQAGKRGVFSWLARTVQRAPVLVILLVLAALTTLALPALHAEVRNSHDDLLISGTAEREFADLLGSQYPAVIDPPIMLVSRGGLEETTQWAEGLVADIPPVSSVQTREATGYIEVAVHLKPADQAGPEARDAVRAIREAEAPFEVFATGQTSMLVDFLDSISQGVPQAALIVVLTMFVLLFAMTGSLLIPIKALLSNAMTLLASLGVVTWIFQDGHLAGLLGFTPVKGLESYVVVLIFIFGFGLAMDYEVFLISRIKEADDQGLETDDAVPFGLQRSGRIITSAALTIVVVFAGFAQGHLVFIKEIGLGLAITVIIDATLVRMLLVPATMTLLGKWNWAAPAPLRRLRSRLAPHVDETTPR